jgi:hypothetical protein
LIRAARIVLALAACVALGAPAAAPAADPGRWVETGHHSVPLEYFQGVTTDRHGDFFFDGFAVGLYRTGPTLQEEARNESAIPAEVYLAEGYNHIGDITWDRRKGGRLLLPLECFVPFFGNTCGTGSIGVADPVTLQWRYYVKLDTAFIDKAMWSEISPSGRLLWTSSGSGDDLLAYRMKDITAHNAAPDGPALKPVRVLDGAVPPSGITGAAFYKGRLLVAGQSGGPFRVWSIDLRDGSRTLEIELPIAGESEGLEVVKALDGVLHWLITPFGTGGRPPTYGSTSALVHFVPAGKAPVKCGDVITRDTKLRNDLVGCPGSGLVIGADDVTLDLNGHTISGDSDFSDSEEAGVQVRGFDEAVVKNGTIENFPQVVNAGDFGAVSDMVIRDIDGDGIFGLVFAVGDRNRIVHSSFTGGGDGGVSVTGNENVIAHNSIVGDWEIPVALHGDGNRVVHNFIRAEEHCQALFDVTGNDNVVRHNDASGGGFCAEPPE